MSFSFRNLFSQGESENESEGEVHPEGERAGDQKSDQEQQALFAESQTTDRGSFEAMFGSTPNPEAEETDNVESFFVGDILPLIPPALATTNTIPLGHQLKLTLPPDGSREVKLSQVGAACPQLFAIEITSLNDSTMTLPTPATAPPQPATPPAGENPFAALTAPPTTTTPATPPGDEPSDNPFWAPESSTPPKEGEQPATPQANTSPFGFPPIKPDTPAATTPTASPPSDPASTVTPQATVATTSPFGFSSPPTQPSPEGASAIESPFGSAPVEKVAMDDRTKPVRSPFAALAANRVVPPLGAPGDKSAASPFGGGEEVTPKPSDPIPVQSTTQSLTEAPSPSAKSEVESPFGALSVGALGSAVGSVESPPATAPKDEPEAEKTAGGFAGFSAPLEPLPSGAKLDSPEESASIQEAKDEPKISFSLKQLLSSSSSEVTGIDAKQIPSDIMAEVPRSFIESKSALSSGPVQVTLGQLLSLIPDEARGKMAMCNREAHVNLPEEEIAKHISVEGAPSSETKVSVSEKDEEKEGAKPFETPFASGAESDSKLAPIPSADIVPGALPWGNGASEPEVDAKKEADEQASESESEKKELGALPQIFDDEGETVAVSAAGVQVGPDTKAGMESLDAIPVNEPAKDEVAEAKPTKVEVTEKESQEELPAKSKEASKGTIERRSIVESKSTSETESPKPEEPASETPALPVSTATISTPSDSTKTEEPKKSSQSSSGSSDPSDLQDIELRAIFGTEGSFTFKSVAKLVITLPGVSACAVTSGRGSAHAEKPEAIGFSELAGNLVDSARDVARAMGLEDAETFTLRTQQGVVSFFLGEDTCLTVRHSDGDFDPGIRERLVLVTRGVARLEK